MNLSKKTFGLAVGAAMLAGGAGGAAIGYQGHMHNALKDLQYASVELMAATPDKAGHRVNAEGLVKQAIGEVQAGIAAGAM